MRLPILVASAMIAFSVSAYADTVSFDVNGTGLTDGYSVTGTIDIDTSTGTVESIYLDADGTIEDSMGALSETLLEASDGTQFQFEEVTSLVDYTGSAFQMLGPNDFYEGEVTEASSVTPEPSSLALLGTGILGVCGVLRRRFV